MALKNTKRKFSTQLEDISGVVDYFQDYFEQKGYTVSRESVATGVFVSLTKGGIFKTIAGLKTGLNITLTQKPGALEASMEVGIFGKQLIATAITLLVAWPVVIPQIIGLVQQNKLDEEAYQVIQDGIRACEGNGSGVNISKGRAPGGSVFCPYCGAPAPAGSVFCNACGKKLAEERKCPSCGAEYPEGAAFCAQCGAKLT